jgi:hypothetical protein
MNTTKPQAATLGNDAPMHLQLIALSSCPTLKPC